MSDAPDFKQPSNLVAVPSFNSTGTAPSGAKKAPQAGDVEGAVVPEKVAVEGIDALIAAMYARPTDFDLTTFTLTDKKTGVSVWIANGWGCYGIHRPSEYAFSLFEQFKFSRAFKKWRALWLAQRFATEMP